MLTSKQEVKPAGAKQFDEYFKNQQGNYKQLQGQWGGLENQYMNLLPQANVLSPQFQGQLDDTMNKYYTQQKGYLDQTWNPLFRNNQFGNVARFGGLNNSVARDTSGELLGQYGKASNDMLTNLLMERQNISNNQLQQQQQGLNNYSNALGYIDDYSKNYLDTVGQAREYAPVTLKKFSPWNYALYNPIVAGIAHNNNSNKNTALKNQITQPVNNTAGIGQTPVVQQAHTQQASDNTMSDIAKYAQYAAMIAKAVA